MTKPAPKKNKPVAPIIPKKQENKKPLISLNIVLGVLLLVFCLMLFKNISYPLLWNDEAETAMNAKQILKYGYPKGHDEKNTIFLPDDTSWLGYKPKYDANISMPWGNYYFALIGVSLANNVTDIYTKTALVRLPFAIIGLIGLVIFILSLSGFFPNRLIYQRFIIAFVFIELLSVSLFLHMREARYYSLVIFFTACFFYVFIQYFFHKKYSTVKYIISMTVVLFFAYQINFVTFVVYCLTIGFFELRYRLANLFSKQNEKEAFSSLLWRQFKIAIISISPVLITLVLISPFLVFFETFSIAAKASAHYGFTFASYKTHLTRIWTVFTTQEFLYPVLFVKAVQILVWFDGRNNQTTNKKKDLRGSNLQKLTFFMTLFFICYCLMVARLPFIWIRYYIVLQPVMIMILLVDMVIIFNYISTLSAKSRYSFLQFAFAAVVVILFIFNADTKINYLKKYTYQLTTQYKGPLDYLIPFMQNKYHKTDTLIVATNYEELCYVYYLNCKVIYGYVDKDLKQDLKYKPDIVIFRKRWGHNPAIYTNVLNKWKYERTSFPVYDYNVNNIAELDFVIQHQFKTLYTDAENEKTDIYTLVK